MSRSLKGLVAGLVACTILVAGCDNDNTVKPQTAAVSKTHSPKFDYTTYQNSRFGFVIKYPSSWIAVPDNINLAGSTFVTPSGMPSYDNGLSVPSVSKTDIVLSVGGNINVAYGPSVGQNFDQMVAAYESSYIAGLRKEKNVSSLSYGVVPNKWIWLSYYQKVGKNAIQYKKSYLSLNTIQEFTFTYPSTQIEKYKPILAEFQRTFVPGNKNS
ncbi:MULTISPECIES: hypothetical protein [Alicyclobacillus]|uniref:Uncharacterized protein n=1 Tax=Alicyclobacillus acidoterrestris (strain ATCC 49025 / DSM 3922 / CIP 106132 / NCIMB 13137 / GD3B) TaxID=1356854 RepID=T0BJK0_ALIAG|nr:MULTISPECIES: hypothetical protein [Alicyclobacillus]EPZ40924.1 hypothetical protein N007_17780 [Alicyclobacillus acidoterrestris ATCC 49025]UNO49434.1 hypothetical protein K1I37_02465 [Alicyclobacillus acidoterrestris]